jgi:hypothetical protein
MVVSHGFTAGFSDTYWRIINESENQLPLQRASDAKIAGHYPQKDGIFACRVATSPSKGIGLRPATLL